MLALLSPPAARERELAALRALAELHGVAFAAASGGHVSFDCGEFRVKWERHTEFSRYVFLREGPGAPFERSALDYVPADWVAALPGELLHAAHAEIVPAAPTQTPQIDTASDAYFGGRPVVGSIVAFQTFGQIDLLTQGGPLQRTNVLTYAIYTALRGEQNEGKAAVLAVALFFVTLVLTVAQMRILERRVHYGD